MASINNTSNMPVMSEIQEQRSPVARAIKKYPDQFYLNLDPDQNCIKSNADSNSNVKIFVIISVK